MSNSTHKNVIEINFYGDESGHLHSNSNKRYFVVGGHFCLKEKSEMIKKNYVRKLIKIKKKRKLNKSDELKAKDMKSQEKIELLEALQNSDGFNGFAIVVDKNAMTKQVQNENIFFNYFIRLVIKEILEPKVRTISSEEDEILVDVKLDNRNVTVTHLKSLEDYLNIEYAFSNYTFKVKYYDSSTEYSIQATDLIANTIYMSFKDYVFIEDVVEHVDCDKIYIIGFPQNVRYKYKTKRN